MQQAASGCSALSRRSSGIETKLRSVLITLAHGLEDLRQRQQASRVAGAIALHGDGMSQPASGSRHFFTVGVNHRESIGNEPGPMHMSSIHQGNAVLKARGVELRWPGFWAFTSASILAIGLWLLLCGIAVRVDSGLNRADFASLLAVIWMSVAFTRLGLDPRSGWTAAALQFAACALAALLAQVLL